MNVSRPTIDAIFLLVKQCFIENRMFDRYVTCLNADFAMNNTSKLCHLGISHMFPLLADKIGETIEKYNISIEYGDTPEAKDTYDSPKTILNEMSTKIIDFQNMLIKAIKIAEDNNDLQVYVELLDILEDYNKVVEQGILLKDKCELYNGNYASFDAHIREHFWILGE